MEVGEWPRLKNRFLFLQGTAKSLMLACLSWSSGQGFHLDAYMCPVDICLLRWLLISFFLEQSRKAPRLFSALLLKVSRKPNTSQAGCSTNFPCAQKFPQRQQ